VFGGVQIVYNFKSLGQISLMIPAAVVDAYALHEIIVLKLLILFEGPDRVDNPLGGDADEGIPSIFLDIAEIAA
jgi:hypothetical protein